MNVKLVAATAISVSVTWAVVFIPFPTEAQGITCDQVRSYAASMGVGQLRALAGQHGISASQQARAMKCLNQRTKRATR